jgi:hypothetical protein
MRIGEIGGTENAIAILFFFASVFFSVSSVTLWLVPLVIPSDFLISTIDFRCESEKLVDNTLLASILPISHREEIHRD